jgi:hypothetical protein
MKAVGSITHVQLVSCGTNFTLVSSMLSNTKCDHKDRDSADNCSIATPLVPEEIFTDYLPRSQKQRPSLEK